MKEHIVILDGVDKTGKDTIKDYLVKQSDGKILVIVRSFISQIVYSRIYKRNINESFFIEKMRNLHHDGNYTFFYLTTRKDELIKRFKKNNEQDLDIKHIDSHFKVFNDVLNKIDDAGIYINHIDTTDKTPDETTRDIIGSIKYN